MLVPVVALLLGVVAAAAAWVFLVRAAIDFGRAAREGHGSAGWALTGGAGFGAALCLLLVFVLLTRAWEQMRSRGRRPRAEPARHRQQTG